VNGSVSWVAHRPAGGSIRRSVRGDDGEFRHAVVAVVPALTHGVPQRDLLAHEHGAVEHGVSTARHRCGVIGDHHLDHIVHFEQLTCAEEVGLVGVAAPAAVGGSLGEHVVGPGGTGDRAGHTSCGALFDDLPVNLGPGGHANRVVGGLGHRDGRGCCQCLHFYLRGVRLITVYDKLCYIFLSKNQVVNG